MGADVSERRRESVGRVGTARLLEGSAQPAPCPLPGGVQKAKPEKEKEGGSGAIAGGKERAAEERGQKTNKSQPG